MKKHFVIATVATLLVAIGMSLFPLPIEAQKYGASSSEVIESATPPTSPRPGPKTWLRTDGAFFVYSSTLGKWVNQSKVRLLFGTNGAPPSVGGLGIGGTGNLSDTTRATPNGIPLRKTLTLRRAEFQCDSASPSSTLQVFKQTPGGAPVLMETLTINAQINYFEGLSSTADSGQLITVYSTTGVPNRPLVWLDFQEEVAAP